MRNFEPRREINGDLELSTFCLDTLEEESRWQLLQANSNKDLVGRTEVATSVFLDAGLTADPDWVPERHVNIVGWPDEEEIRKGIAQSLYAAQRFIARTESVAV